MISLIADAVLPIAWILGLGFSIKRFSNVGKYFWRGLEWVSYWVLMPSLLIAVIIRAPDISVPWGPLIGSVYFTLGIITVFAIVAWRINLLGPSYASFTSVYQGIIRFNTFVSLALAAGLRPDLLPHVGIAAGAIIIIVNIACVSVMTAKHSGFELAHVVRELSKNPLILGCVIGVMGRMLGLSDSFLVSGLALMGQAALPMGVLCLGAGLQWRAVRAGLGLTLFSVATQLFVKPLLFIGLALWMGLSGDWVLVGLLLTCVSTAASSYILARQLGGDTQLMAGIVAVQTVLSIVSVPMVLWFADSMNWIKLT
tara:strand:+ start:2542 stop:3477 length:936 start_codon:yes stop_codon:yes gene_type:complete